MGIKFVRWLEVCRQGQNAAHASLREPVLHFREGNRTGKPVSLQ